MTVPVLEAVLLGVLQGLTEFLPVSSSGHLALAQLLFEAQSSGLMLSVVLHAGTLLATVVYFRERIGVLLRDSYRFALRRVSWQDAPGARDAGFVVVASIPTGIMGLTMKDAVENWSRSPWILGFGFLVTSLLLVSTRWRDPDTRTDASLKLAFVLGIVQGCAILPGISRSGSTISGALCARISPPRAFELSMLMSLPAVAGAFLLELREVLGAQGSAPSLVLGALTSFGVGLAALALLRRVLTLGRFSLFALWVLPLALATLGLAWAWPIS